MTGQAATWRLRSPHAMSIIKSPYPKIKHDSCWRRHNINGEFLKRNSHIWYNRQLRTVCGPTKGFWHGTWMDRKLWRHRLWRIAFRAGAGCGWYDDHMTTWPRWPERKTNKPKLSKKTRTSNLNCDVWLDHLFLKLVYDDENSQNQLVEFHYTTHD